MAINPKDFIPRAGFINKQGCIPDPLELCCIQVPKIFDQCLIKKCLKPSSLPGSEICQLCQPLIDSTGAAVTDPSKVKKIGCCRNFDVEITSISKSCIKGEEGYKRVTVNFQITFKVDVLIEDPSGTSCTPQTLNYTVNQTITVPKFYCPDPIAQVSSSKGCICNPDIQDEDEEIIKLEVVADCLRSELVKVDCLPSSTDEVCLCITLGLFIIVKSELLVQLLIPCYGYCPTPAVCPGDTDPCTEFSKRQPPVFYPPQKMDNLFPDYVDYSEEE